ncbi:MAG: hypothetical protein K1X94_13125 [Sandaracinaceae bacterium]|nr:hypothetical protein [Sandaracinaceae bacterium]
MLLRRTGRSVFGGVLLSLSLTAMASGCSRPPPPTGLDIPRGEAPEGWPAILVSTAGRAPALYAGSDDAAPAFGHLGDGVRVRVEGAIQGQRVPVTVGGNLVVHAWAQVNRLAAFTSRRGRVEGTPVFVGVNDPVSLVGRENDTTYRIIVRPRLGRPDVDDTLVGYAAMLGTDWIGEGDGVEADTGLNPGEFRLLPAGQEVPLYDRPGGTVVARLPPLDPPLTVVVLRSRDGWNGVRVGVGPYLVGYVQGELAPSTAEALGARPRRAATTEAMPSRIANETGALFRVAAGTHVMFYGEDVATVRREAWARELSPRQGDQADVYIAADDGVAIRGVVPVSSLTPVTDGAAAQPGAAPASATPAPAGGTP